MAIPRAGKGEEGWRPTLITPVPVPIANWRDLLRKLSGSFSVDSDSEIFPLMNYEENDKILTTSYSNALCLFWSCYLSIDSLWTVVRRQTKQTKTKLTILAFEKVGTTPPHVAISSGAPVKLKDHYRNSRTYLFERVRETFPGMPAVADHLFWIWPCNVPPRVNSVLRAILTEAVTLMRLLPVAWQQLYQAGMGSFYSSLLQYSIRFFAFWSLLNL